MAPQFKYKNNNRFQLFNSNENTWAAQINKPPILLAERDLKNWLVFKTNELVENQLYLWHATKFDWVPLWSCKKGFLLLNLNILKFDKVNFTQFTKAGWIRENSVSPKQVKILLNTHNIPTDIIDQMQPVISASVQDGQVAATGQPYFINYNDTSYNKIPLYNQQRQGWGVNRWFDKRDDRFNYQFIKEF